MVFFWHSEKIRGLTPDWKVSRAEDESIVTFFFFFLETSLSDAFAVAAAAASVRSKQPPAVTAVPTCRYEYRERWFNKKGKLLTSASI
jgi:hypothetical protein